MELKDSIENRKSVKHFSKEKPDWRNIVEAIDSARFAPMAGNLFSLKFILIDDSKKIKKLAKFAEQDFIKEAKYVVVACSNPSRVSNSFEEKGEVYMRQQAGAAMQNFVLTLEDFGLSTCWVGHFLEGEVKKLLNIPDDVHVEAFFPIGYENKIKKSRRKRKIDLEVFLRFNDYKNKRMNG